MDCKCFPLPREEVSCCKEGWSLCTVPLEETGVLFPLFRNYVIAHGDYFPAEAKTVLISISKWHDC